MEQVSISITESAYADLEDIESYISQDSPAIARKFINKIFDKIDQLYLYPASGKPVPEISDRSIQITDKKNISIVRIVHGSRLLDIEI